MKASLFRKGFTLVEMLVAMAIVSFMMLMMAQITGLAEQAWLTEQNRIDNFTKARSMLDLIAADLQRGVFRGDLPAFGAGAPAATPTATANGLYYYTGTSFTNAFYTRMPGVPSSATTQVRDLSLVSYVIATNQAPDKVSLQRSDLAVPWTNSAGISFQGDLTPLLQNATPLDVAPGVVGFRFAFRRADGTMIDQTQYTGYNATNPVVAVDACVAVIGKESLLPLTTAQLQNIQNAFASPISFTGASATNGIKANWDQQVLTTSFYSLYPKTLGTGIKTFERWVACTPF